MSDDLPCHAAVVGGGLVGAAAALALLKSGLRVALIEPQPAAAPVASFDHRIYAVSPASEALLRELGAWQRLDTARVQAIYRMEVSGDHGGHLRFDAYEAGVERLATILENGRLQHALWQAIAERADAVVRAPCAVEAIDWSAPYSTLHLSDGSTLRTELVVGADGGHSRVRMLAGLEAVVKDYPQHGVVANFACERPHRGTAFQWFGNQDAASPLQRGDVFTYLPLPGCAASDAASQNADFTTRAGNRVSLVWSTRHARELLALDTAAFTRQVELAGGERLGRLALVTPPTAYPLRQLRVPRVFGDGVVLIGDAAHGVHPLAGQGVNLGFGDVAALRRVLAGRGLGRCGDARLLGRYARQRAWPVARMHGVLHGLFYLFDTQGAHRLSNSGMNRLDALAPVKSLMVREATHFSL